MGKLPELVQLQHQVQKAWRVLEAQSSSFKANGALSPEEHEQGLEQIKPVMAQINGILQDRRMQLSALQAGPMPLSRRSSAHTCPITMS